MNKELVQKKEDQGTPAPAEEKKQESSTEPNSPADAPVQGSNEEKKEQEEEKKEDEQAQGDEQAQEDEQASQPGGQTKTNDQNTPKPTGQAAQEEYKKNQLADPTKLPDRTPANVAARGKFLKDEYVTKHNDAKAKDEADLQTLRAKISGGGQGGPGAPGGPVGQGGQGGQGGLAPGTSDSQGLQTADKVMDGLGTAMGHVTDIGNIVGDSLDVADVDSNFGDGWGTATGAMNAVFNGYGTVRSIMGTAQAGKNGNRVGRNAGIFDSIGGLFQTSGDLATMGAGIGGLAGGSDNSGNIGNIVAGSLGTLGSISSMIGSSYRTQKYRTGRKKLNALKVGDSNANKTEKDTALNTLKGDHTRANLDAYDAARQKRQGMKARRFAAEMGAAKASMNYKAAGWDTLSNVAGTLSGLTSLGAGIAGVTGSNIAKLVNTCVGAALNIIPTIAKAKNAASEKLRGDQNRDKYIDEYIAAKKASLKAAADAQIGDANKKLTDGELENIIIARLGVDPDANIAPESVKAQKKDAIFDLICEKRANYIAQADEATRTELLTAMGLDPKNASMTAIKEALGG